MVKELKSIFSQPKRVILEDLIGLAALIGLFYGSLFLPHLF